MPLLIVSPSFYPAVFYGGPTFASYEVAKILAESGYKVYVSTTNANGKDRIKVKTNTYLKMSDNLFVKYYGHGLKNGFSLFMILGLWKDILKSESVYLISIFSPLSPLTILLCKLFRKKIIINPMGQLGDWCIHQGSRYKRIWLRLFVKPYIPSLVFHVASEQERDSLISLYTKVTYFLIPNIINMSFIKFNNFNKNILFFQKYNQGIGPNSKVIVSLGRLHRVKGYDILINAFDMVQQTIPDIFLFIAGEDYGEKEHLEKIIMELNLTEKVVLIGAIEGEKKMDYLKNADIFALASHHESFGNVYAEALAFGLPIVASKNTPWQEVETLNLGKWVNNTAEEFARALIELLTSDYKIFELNRQNYVYEKFSKNSIMKKFKIELKKYI